MIVVDRQAIGSNSPDLYSSGREIGPCTSDVAQPSLDPGKLAGLAPVTPIVDAESAFVPACRACHTFSETAERLFGKHPSPLRILQPVGKLRGTTWTLMLVGTHMLGPPTPPTPGRASIHQPSSAPGLATATDVPQISVQRVPSAALVPVDHRNVLAGLPLCSVADPFFIIIP